MPDCLIAAKDVQFGPTAILCQRQDQRMAVIAFIDKYVTLGNLSVSVTLDDAIAQIGNSATHTDLVVDDTLAIVISDTEVDSAVRIRVFDGDNPVAGTVGIDRPLL